MALYSLSVKPISRKDGRSATASAAYRAASEIVDERTGLVHDYTRKRGVEHVELFAQAGITLDDPASLWNAAESAEKRKDGRTAREVLVALPAELDADQRTALAREMTRELVERYGVAAQLAIHAPDKAGDQRNHHAHILLTTRRYNHDGLGAKSQLEWSATQCKKHKVAKPQGELKALRERWADMQNAALKRADCVARVDHRSLAAQGIDRAPEVHQGGYATDMIRQGTPEQSDRAMLNLSIIDTNVEVQSLRVRLDTERAVQEWTEITPVTPRLTTPELPDPVPSPAADAELALTQQSARMDVLERVEQHIGHKHQLQIRADLRSLERAQQRVQQRQAEEAERQAAERQLEAESECQEARAQRQGEREREREKEQQEIESKRPVSERLKSKWDALCAIDQQIEQLNAARSQLPFLKFSERKRLKSEIENLSAKRAMEHAQYAELWHQNEAEKAAAAAQPSARDMLRQTAAKIRKERPDVAAEFEKTAEQSASTTKTEPKPEQPKPFDAKGRALEILTMDTAEERHGALHAASSLDLNDFDALMDELDPLMGSHGELNEEGQLLRAKLVPREMPTSQHVERIQKSEQDWESRSGPDGPGF